MAEINFQIDSTALQTIQNTELKANFEETKTALAEIVYPYTKMIVSEDAIVSAKSDRAKINKIKTNIDSYRKMVKAAYNEPYKKIEVKFKELTAICDEGITNIDEQVAEYEKKRKDEKLFLLREYYNNREKKNPEYCSFEFALHPKWELKGTSLEECKEYIDNAVKKVDSEVFAIRGIHSEWEVNMLADYKKTHDMLSAMEIHERLTLTRQQEEERRRKEREAYEARLKATESNLSANGTATDEPQPFDFNDVEKSLASAIQADMSRVEPQEQMYVATFRIYGTMDEIMAVKRYCTQHAIEAIYDGKEPTDKPIEAFL